MPNRLRCLPVRSPIRRWDPVRLAETAEYIQGLIVNELHSRQQRVVFAVVLPGRIECPLHVVQHSQEALDQIGVGKLPSLGDIPLDAFLVVHIVRRDALQTVKQVVALLLDRLLAGPARVVGDSHGGRRGPGPGFKLQVAGQLVKVITVEEPEIREEVARLTKPLDDPIIALGCPHSSLGEIEEIASLVQGRDFSGRLWVFTSRGVYAEAERAGHVRAIEEARGRVYRDTCMVIAPLREMGWTEVATNSFKAGHYMAGMGMRTRMGTIRELLTEADL